VPVTTNVFSRPVSVFARVQVRPGKSLGHDTLQVQPLRRGKEMTPSLFNREHLGERLLVFLSGKPLLLHALKGVLEP
jgi:hypothetical protein